MKVISLIVVLMTLAAGQAQSAPAVKANEMFITLFVQDSGGGMQADVAHAIRNYADFYLNQIGIPHSVSLARGLDNGELSIPVGGRTPENWLLVIPHLVADQDTPKRIELELQIQRMKMEGSQRVRDSAIINVSSRKDWLAAMGDSGSSSSFMPEPTQFIIRRAVERMCEGFKPLRAVRAGVESPIYTTIYVDSTFIQSHGPEWPGDIERITDVVSRSLLRQFGRSLVQNQIIMSHTDPGSLQQTFDALKRLSGPSDTLDIMLLERRTSLEYFTGQVSDQLGMTDLGGSRIAIDCIPSPSQKDDLWFPFANGLSLLHEVGHAFGAIHVFDHRSIMSPRLHWIGTDSFDSLNISIMREIIAGRVDASRPVEYVALVSRALRDSRYPYADFPDFFWRYLANAKSSAELDSLTTAIAHEPFFIAADALNLLKQGDKTRARLRWKQALELEPEQPVLLYYLALSSTGADSANAMARSIELGLFPAVSAYQITDAKLPR